MGLEGRNVIMERLLTAYIIHQHITNLVTFINAVTLLGSTTKSEAMDYINAQSEADLEKYINDNELEDWMDIVCESETFNGNFYTDNNENLFEGYPC